MRELTKKEKASQRNWLLARITGFPLPYCGTPITEAEGDIFREIARLKDLLLDNWDENSKILGMNPKPKKVKTF